MSEQLTSNPEALRLFFTEDIFLVNSNTSASLTSIITEMRAPETPAVQMSLQEEPPAPESQIPAIAPLSEALVQQTSEAVELQFQYVGANERNILILVNDEQYPVSSLQGRELLGNILKSINLNRNDCALVNYAGCDHASFAQLQDFFKPQLVFAFGVSPNQLGISKADSNTIVLQEETRLIFSSNLDALSGDPATKKLLWASLKQIIL